MFALIFLAIGLPLLAIGLAYALAITFFAIITPIVHIFGYLGIGYSKPNSHWQPKWHWLETCFYRGSGVYRPQFIERVRKSYEKYPQWFEANVPQLKKEGFFREYPELKDLMPQ